MDKSVQQQRVAREKGSERAAWMTSGELCRFLNISPRTFRYWRQQGKAPAPAETTSSGYGLWSPAQQQDLLRKRANLT